METNRERNRERYKEKTDTEAHSQTGTQRGTERNCERKMRKGRVTQSSLCRVPLGSKYDCMYQSHRFCAAGHCALTWTILNRSVTAGHEIENEAGVCKNGENKWRFCRLHQSLHSLASFSISATWVTSSHDRSLTMIH